MQVLKKYLVLFLLTVVAGCRSAEVATQSGFDSVATDYGEVSLGGRSDFRVGVLLPLDFLRARRTAAPYGRSRHLRHSASV